MANIICLGGGIEGVPIIERVKALGHAAIVVDGNADAPGMRLADTSIVESCYNPYCVIRVDKVPDAVLCCGVDAPHVASSLGRTFDRPGLTPPQAALSVDKLAQKQALRAAGLPVPDFAEFDITVFPSVGFKYADGDKKVSGVWGAGVIKPVDSRGARGVSLVRSGELMTAAMAYAGIDASPTKRIMLERFLDGPQLSTESLVQDGHVLFTAIGLRNYGRLAEFAPHIIEDGFDSPYPFAGVDALIERACAALGWYQQGGGVVKGDLVIRNGELVIIELAARLSGGFFGMAHEWAYGVPFIDLAIRLALGERIAVEQKAAGRFVSQRYVFPDIADVGRRVKDVEIAFYPNGCEHATVVVKPGDTIAPVTSHGQRWGQAMATGDTPKQAQARAEVAVAQMKKAVTLE